MECKGICDANTTCAGYAYIADRTLCCQKRWVGPKVVSKGKTAGIKPSLLPSKLTSTLLVERSNSSKVPLQFEGVNAKPYCSNCTVYSPLRVEPDDASLTLRVLLDRSVIEAYGKSNADTSTDCGYHCYLIA